jgi:hypothetical protein
MTGLVLLLIPLAVLVAVVLFVLDAAMGAWERLAELPEVAGFAADRTGQVMLAIATAVLVAALAYLEAQHGPWVLAIAGLAMIGLLEVVALSGRPPHCLPRRVIWRLGFWPRLCWTDRLFLGWSRGRTHRWRWAMARREDSVGIIGPPRRNKTMGVITPQLELWRGPAVSTSVKPDVLRATAARRLQLAWAHGGDVYVYAPMARGPVEGLIPVRWSPLARCRDDAVVPLRVDVLVEASDSGGEAMDANHWRTGAKQILRGCFYAAAHHERSPGNLALVQRWLATKNLQEPLSILSRLGTPAATLWAQELVGVHATPSREQASFFARARDSLAATADPAVMESCSRTDLDVERFLKTRSTLYVVSPSQHQKRVAPLIAALLESIITTAYELHQRGQLDARLLASLDELANIAPLPNLSTHVSQGAGQGVNITWAVQSHAQLRERYGEHTAEAIWSSTTAKLVFGGLADDEQLQRISHLVGEHRVRTKSTAVKSRGLLFEGSDHGAQVTHGWEWRPRLPAAAIRELRWGWALLLYNDRKAYCLRVPIAQHKWVFRLGLRPWAAPREGLLEEVPAAERRAALVAVSPEANGRRTGSTEDAGEEVER